MGDGSERFCYEIAPTAGRAYGGSFAGSACSLNDRRLCNQAVADRSAQAPAEAQGDKS
jgi:hypothetical protein